MVSKFLGLEHWNGSCCGKWEFLLRWIIYSHLSTQHLSQFTTNFVLSCRSNFTNCGYMFHDDFSPSPPKFSIFWIFLWITTSGSPNKLSKLNGKIRIPKELKICGLLYPLAAGVLCMCIHVYILCQKYVHIVKVEEHFSTFSWYISSCCLISPPELFAIYSFRWV